MRPVPLLLTAGGLYLAWQAIRAVLHLGDVAQAARERSEQQRIDGVLEGFAPPPGWGRR